jgi:succinoglycan biosynthesis transport protein ExoP
MINDQLLPGSEVPATDTATEPHDRCHTSRLQFAGSQEWTALECLQILHRRRATLLSMIGTGVLVATLVSVLQPRKYRSEAVLEIQGVNENFLDARDIYPTTPSSTDAGGTYLQTQAELLQQDVLVKKVVRKLGLEARLGPRSPNFESAVEMVKRNVQIVLARGSRIVRIVAVARDPQLAADIANAMAQTFIEQTLDSKQQAAQQTYTSLSQQLRELRRKVQMSEAALAADRPVPERFSETMASAISHDMLRRDVELNRRFYDSMAQRVNEAQVASAVYQSNIRLAGPAQPASRAYRPNVPLNLGIGMLGGIVLAIGWVMLSEQSNSLLLAPGDAGMYLTLPELGAIPQVANPGLVVCGRNLAGNGTRHVTPSILNRELAKLSEPFRATLASILSTGSNGDRPHILVVTSAQAMEGKTTVVSNLGVGLAEIGNKVLLIDGDMRRPQLHRVFNQANTWGLSDVLSETNAVEELPLDVLVRKTSVPRISLLPSGAFVDNIFGLLWASRLARLLPRFRSEFDYVLVDAPPCLEFADARIMARHADQLLFVVRANHTDRRTAQAAVQRLLLDGISVMGVILNRCDPSQRYTYNYPTYCGFKKQGLT